MNSITFDGTGYTIATNGGTLTLTGTGGNITVNQAAAISQAIDGTVGLTKLGGATLTLSGANGYSGTTAIKAGTLTVSSTGTINTTSGVTIGTASTAATAEFNYNSSTALSQTVSFATSSTGGILSGTGTITNAVTVTSGNIYSAGTKGGVGIQTLTNGISLASGSIFSWDIDVNGASETHDTVAGGASTVAGSIFEVVLGVGDSFNDTFWDTNRTWTNIFSTGSEGFTAFSGSGVAPNGTVALQGNFTYTGGTLTWSAVPEPTSALAGILLGAGLLRRRRSI